MPRRSSRQADPAPAAASVVARLCSCLQQRPALAGKLWCAVCWASLQKLWTAPPAHDAGLAGSLK